jgi:hypothetical protein
LGKKHKKFKKRMQREIQKLHAMEQAQASAVVQDSSDNTPEGESERPLPANKPADNTKYHELDKEYSHIRRDVLKIIVSLGSILVLLFILFFLNQKTGMLTGLGDWAYRVSNIHTQ